ncbi:MAG: tape measure protein [Armatimonadetes bacterium]|nr:tape measure protein [Armatimonadota bacterium]
MATNVNDLEEVYGIKDNVSPALEEMAKKAEQFERKLKEILDTLKHLGSSKVRVGSGEFEQIPNALNKILQQIRSIGSQIQASLRSAMSFRIPISVQRPNFGGFGSGSGGGFGGGGFGGGSGSASGGGGGFGGFLSNFLLAIPEVGPILKGTWDIFRHIYDTASRITQAIFNWRSALASLGLYKLMEIAGQMEAFKLSLRAIMGSATAGDRQYRRNEALAKLPGIGYEEAFQRFNQLYETGADSRMSERIIQQFGNANALVGGGKDEFSNIMLAITQLLTKSELSGEEVNRQLSQYLPMLRPLMMKAFGTSDTEKVAKMVTPQQFIERMLDELEKLPRAADGAKNSLENIDDIFKRVAVSIGNSLNRILLPSLKDAADWIDNLVSKDVPAVMINTFLSAFGGPEALKLGGNLSGATYGGLKLDALHPAPAAQYFGNPSNKLGWALKFIGEGSDFGDKLKRAMAVAGAAFLQIPTIVEKLAKIVNYFFEAVDWLFSKMNEMMKRIAGSMIGKLLGLNGADFEGAPIKTVDMNKLTFDGGKLANDAKLLYELGKSPLPGGEDVANDPSKGGWNQQLAQITGLNKELVDLQKQQNEVLTKTMLGGGALAEQAFSYSNLNHLSKGIKGGTKLDQALEALKEAIHEIAGDRAIAVRTYNPLRA